MPRRIITVRLWPVLLAFVGVTAAFVVQGVLLTRLVDRADTSRDALCAQRDDLDQRITATSNVLEEHRGEQLVFGIPRKLIVTGLKRDRVTRHNLEILDCKPL